MANTTADFIKYVEENLQYTAGASKSIKVSPQFGDGMNDQLKTFKNGMNMKIRFECTGIGCGRDWTSACGITQWYYCLKPIRNQRGSILGYQLFFKVHAYTQKCERCEGQGKIDPYDDEYDRLSKRLCNHLAKEMNCKPKFKEAEPRKSNMRRPH